MTDSNPHSEVQDSHVEVQLEAVVDGLVAHTGGKVRRHDLRAMVFSAYADLARDAKVTTYLPVLAGRAALRQVEQQGLAAADRQRDIPAIVVIGESNAARSQSAAAMLRFYAPGRFTVQSAGVDPLGVVDPMVVQMMGEVGAELTDAPQEVTPGLLRDASHVIAIGDPAPKLGDDSIAVLEWQIAEPSLDSATEVLDMLRQIDTRVRDFLLAEDPDHELHDPLFVSE